jgi:hypothetical protein
MKGNNELKLNTATMIIAVQEYLEKRWANTVENCPKVTNVEAASNGYGQTFTVSLVSDEKQ